jgi:hypothetical protein
MTAPSLSKQEVVAFFERYGAEFDQRNWAEFVALYHEPSLTVRGDGTVKYFQSRAEAKQFFENVANAWCGEGYHRFAMGNFDVAPIGRRSVLATLDWDLLREDGSLIRRWRQSYQLIQVQQNWLVLASTFHAA